jgi:hypothetical protein
VLELAVDLSAEQVLEECKRRGLVVGSERALGSCEGGRHWHLRVPDRAGNLELNERMGRVWVKVHPRRDGDWARPLAGEPTRCRDHEDEERTSRGPAGALRDGAGCGQRSGLTAAFAGMVTGSPVEFALVGGEGTGPGGDQAHQVDDEVAVVADPGQARACPRHAESILRANSQVGAASPGDGEGRQEANAPIRMGQSGRGGDGRGRHGGGGGELAAVRPRVRIPGPRPNLEYETRQAGGRHRGPLRAS